MNHGFQDFNLNTDEKTWMSTVYDSGDFNVDRTHEKLDGKIANDFDPNDIDPRLYKRNHLTLIGIFHVDPKSPVFGHVQSIMELISVRIKQNDDFTDITSLELSNVLDISVDKIEHAVYFLSEMGPFFDGVYRHSADAGSLVLNFKTDQVRAKYKHFMNLGDVMEDYFQSRHLFAPVSNTDDVVIVGDGDGAEILVTPTPTISQGSYLLLQDVACLITGFLLGLGFAL